MLQTETQQPNQQQASAQQIGDQKHDLIMKLSEAVNEVNDELKRGLSPEEYQKAEKLSLALKAAIEVVQQEGQQR